MTSASEWFARSFGQAPPIALAEGMTQTPGRLHWSTVDDARLGPDALVTPGFPEGPEDYTVIGHWGFGIGSQAFYFVRSEAAHRCFLRVAFGGAYDDDPRQAQQILIALESYSRLRALETLCASEIVYSMRTGHGRLETEGRAPIEVDIWQASSGTGAPAPRVGEFLRFIERRVEAL